MPEPRPLQLSAGDMLSVATPDGGSAYLEITGPLGAGGGGQVWTAVDDGGRVVVVKGPRLAGTRDAGLEREVELMSALPAHPCLPRLVGVVRDPRGHVLLLVERLHKNPLAALSEPEVRAKLDEKTRGRHAALPPALALELGYELARALDHLHAQRVAHCDVKPANLLLAMDDLPDGDPRAYFERLVRGQWRGVLIDLGGARRFRELNPQAAGSGAPPALTPIYAPPEVIPGLWDERSQRERSHFTPWIDSYAFGLVLYQLVTGRAPYDHLPERPDLEKLASIAEVKREERDGAHRPLSKGVVDGIDWHGTDLRGVSHGEVLERLWELLQRATHHEPARRATARQLREGLGKLLQVEPRPTNEPGARDWIQRRLVGDAFEGPLARLARGGAPAADLGKLRRGGKDFWEMQGYGG